MRDRNVDEEEEEGIPQRLKIGDNVNVQSYLPHASQHASPFPLRRKFKACEY